MVPKLTMFCSHSVRDGIGRTGPSLLPVPVLPAVAALAAGVAAMVTTVPLVEIPAPVFSPLPVRNAVIVRRHGVGGGISVKVAVHVVVAVIVTVPVAHIATP